MSSSTNLKNLTRPKSYITGKINVKEGDYAITLIFGLEKGESVVAKTFIMPRYVAVFIAINVVLCILLLFALTILFIKKYCCRD